VDGLAYAISLSLTVGAEMLVAALALVLATEYRRAASVAIAPLPSSAVMSEERSETSSLAA
jgi:hypothetical protein